MPKLILSKEEALDIVYRDHDTAKVIRDVLIDTTRWSKVRQITFELNGKLYQGTYRKGSTESQDEQPFEYTEPVFCEVEAFEKTITDYRSVTEEV
jgi:hypothetical protein